MFGAPKPATGGGLFSSTPSGGATGFSFGQQSQQQQPQQSQQQQPPPGGGLFGQQPQQQQQPSIGGLFGSKPTGAGTGLFGSAGTNPGGGGTGGGLFGEAATSAPTSNPSGGLFGQPSTAASAAGAPKPLSLGNASTTQTGAGMFGQQPQQQQSSAVGGGLFGFGQQTNTGAQQQQGGSLFGQRPGGAFGTSTFGPSAPGSQPFGAATTAATQTQPQNHFLQFPYHQKERFNDLPDQQKQLVEQLDQFIQQQVQTRKQLEASKDAEEISKASQEIWSIQSDLKSLTALIDSDHIAISDLRGNVEADRKDSNTMFEIGHNWQQGFDNSHLRSFPLNYFSRAVADIAGRVTRYKTTMEEIQRQLISVDHRDIYTPDAIQNAIQAQNVSFMALATKIAAVHADIQTLKADYTHWYQQQYRSLRDPFSMQLLESTVP